ncbi:MAG: hypothetical protein APR62_11710 [Smithella sp. SDB]|nr:MAG: hypothetical protein APR62_11710 [Smithella sp. SDB]
MAYKKHLKTLLSIVVVTLFGVFFYKEFKENWESVRTFHLQVNWGYILVGILMIIANYLCTTLGWHMGISCLDKNAKIKYSQSIALVNISQLGKYIPGKLWSYVVQIYWLASKGVPKTTALYLNAMTAVLPVLVSLLMGSFLLMMCSDWHHLKTGLTILICLLIIVNLLIFNRNIMKLFVDMVSRISGRKFVFRQLSTSRILSMELFYIIGAFFWGLAGCFIAMGMGINLNISKIISISSAMLLGDVIGFLILIVPGGLGVREGTMYLILRNADGIQFALIFPMIIRLITLIADLIMGVVSVLIIGRKKYFPSVKEIK